MVNIKVELDKIKPKVINNNSTQGMKISPKADLDWMAPGKP